MPHLVLAGELPWSAAAHAFTTSLERAGRAVLKIEELWQRVGTPGLLINGVVVEFARPLHPVAVVVPHHADTIVRLWPLAPVERTAAVQRWLGLVAVELQRAGAGPVNATNIPCEMLSGLPLQRTDS